MPVLAALAAGLLAIVGAAGPKIGHAAGAEGRTVIVILDRGLTMSARQGNQRRFQRLAAESTESIVHVLGPSPALLEVGPGDGERQVNLPDLPAAAGQLDPTAVDSKAWVRDAVGRALLDPQALVLLLSDQTPDVVDPRLIDISPPEKLQNVGIAALTVRTLAGGPTSAMVRLVNDSAIQTATLRVSGADPVSVFLPASGNAANYFVALKGNPAVVEASVTPGGDIDAEDHAWAVRGPAWPKVSVHCLLPMELQRMVGIYSRDRLAGPESRTVAMLPIVAGAPPDQPAALVMTESMAGDGPPAGEGRSAPDSLTDGIDWNAALNGAEIARTQPDSSWRRLVWTGDQALVAERTNPVRQIWVGFRNGNWAATPQFVLFWSRAFDWLGEAGDIYRSQTVGGINGLWPGLRVRDGRTIAANAPAAPIAPAVATDWQARLSAWASGRPAGRVDLSPWLLAAAAGCLAIAAGYFGRDGRIGLGHVGN